MWVREGSEWLISAAMSLQRVKRVKSIEEVWAVLTVTIVDVSSALFAIEGHLEIYGTAVIQGPQF